MRLKKSGARQVGRIGTLYLTVWKARLGPAWHGAIRVGGTRKRYRKDADTLRDLKDWCLREWWRHWLNKVIGRFGAAVRPLYAECWDGDAVAPSVLCDWLTDNGGEVLVRRLVAEGREAGVKWPEGLAPIDRRVK